MTEPTKDKGNGKPQETVKPLAGLPVSDVDIWFIVGVSKKTGGMIIAGPKVEELQKFKERKTREQCLDLLIEALNTVMANTKQSQKKSSILRVGRNIFLPGGTHD